MSPIFCYDKGKVIKNERDERMRKEHTFYSAEKKLGIVQRYLSSESPKALRRETGIRDGCIRKRKPLAGGEAALENQRKPGSPLATYTRRKELSHPSAN